MNSSLIHHLSPFEQKILRSVRWCRNRRAERSRRVLPQIRRDVRIVYVIAKDSGVFLEYVKLSGRKLQDCKFLAKEEDCLGVEFSNPDRELVEISGWSDRKTKQEAWFRLISIYCRDRRIDHVPQAIL